MNQKIVTWLLAPLNCQIDIVENGLQAVAAVTRSTYDLVLMDVHMPEMDGITATQKIRSLPGPVAAIPTIALTADAMQGDRKTHLAAGMNDSVVKPIEQRALLGSITRCARIAMPNLDLRANAVSVGGEAESRPLSQAAADDVKNLIGDIDHLLDGTGR